MSATSLEMLSLMPLCLQSPMAPPPSLPGASTADQSTRGSNEKHYIIVCVCGGKHYNNSQNLFQRGEKINYLIKITHDACKELWLLPAASHPPPAGRGGGCCRDAAPPAGQSWVPPPEAASGRSDEPRILQELDEDLVDELVLRDGLDHEHPLLPEESQHRGHLHLFIML